MRVWTNPAENHRWILSLYRTSSRLYREHPIKMALAMKPLIYVTQKAILEKSLLLSHFFARFQRSAFGAEAMRESDDFIPTRKSLLNRLKDSADQESWQLFFDTYWRLIYKTAVESGLTDAEAQEVVQETMIRVWKKMPTFQYDPVKGSFKSWLLHLTGWRITAQLRKRRP